MTKADLQKTKES